MLLLAECKRANPGLSNWCFIRTPFTRRTGLANSLVLEAGIVNLEYQPVMRKIQYPTNKTEFFHIALPSDGLQTHRLRRHAISYQGDKLSHLALSSESVERHSSCRISGLAGGRTPGAYFAEAIGVNYLTF
jgi:hypothetical protein